MKLAFVTLLLLVVSVEQANAAVYCKAGAYVRGCVARPGVVTPIPQARPAVRAPMRIYRPKNKRYRERTMGNVTWEFSIA